MLRGFDDARRLLSGRDWAYLLCLLVPVALYGLALKALSLTRYAQELGFWEVLELLRSDLLFDAGYAALWVGLFTLFRHGHGRAAALVLLHLTAVLIVVIETCAFQYLETTGTTLDYSVVAYYLSTPGEAAGAVSSETPLYAWAVLSAAILYALAGPVLLLNLFAGRDASPLPEHVPGGRTLTRGRFIAASLGAGAGVFLLRESLLPVAAQGQAGSVSRSPVSNLIATRIEEVRMEAAAAEVEALNRLSDLRLRATPRTRKRHIALIHLES
ncbi:MAG: sulfatase, partial [Actinomycetota bacterium]